MMAKKTVKVNGNTIEVPKGQIFCEKCGAVNFFYDDMKPPYMCDNCAAPLDESFFEEIDFDEAEYAHNEGRYDGEC